MKYILLPVEEQKDLIGIRTSEDKGIVKMNCVQALKTVEEIIETENQGDEDHAIPSPISYVQYYTKKISQMNYTVVNGNQLNLIENADQYYEWFGMLGILALNEFYGIKVEFKSFPMVSSLGKVFKEAICEDLDFIDNPTNFNQLYIMVVNNEPMAYIHSTLLLCPFKEYKKDVLKDVPWYSYKEDNETGEWTDFRAFILQNQDGTQQNTTAMGEVMNQWLHNLLTKVSQVGNRRHNCYDNINKLKTHLLSNASGTNLMVLGGTFTLGYKSNIINNSSLWGYRLSPGCFDSATLPALPQKIFTDKLGLINLGSDTQNAKVNFKYAMIGRFTTNGPGEEMTYLCFIPPIFQGIAIANGGNLIINNVEYDSEKLQADNIVKVTITFEVVVDGGGRLPVTMSKDFTDGDILYFESFPYMSLWPHVNLPANQWRYYLLSVFEKNEKNSSPKFLRNNNVMCEEKKISFVYYREDGSTLSTKQTADGEMKWDICSARVTTGQNNNGATVFSFSKIKLIDCHYTLGQQSVSCGALCLDYPTGNGTVNPITNYEIGIDFGTTNTNCYGKAGNNPPRPIPSHADKLLNITQAPVELERIRNLYWVTTRKITQNRSKFMTCAKTFNGVGTEIYINGKIFYLDENEVEKLVFKDGAGDGIYTNLKFSNNVPEARAATIFIKQLILNALLEGALAGQVGNYDIKFSYPHIQAFQGIQANFPGWIQATDLGGICPNASINAFKMSEAEAVGQYFLGTMANGMNNSTGTLDIGGGTSDISIWQGGDNGVPPMAIKKRASIQYAGNKLVARSIFNSVDGNNFSGLWNNAIMKFNEFYSNEIRSLQRNVPLDDLSYLRVQNMLNVLLQDNGINLNNLTLTLGGYRKLEVVMRLRYTFLFYLYGKFLKKCIDNGDVSLGSSHQINIVGGGANGLKVCIGNQNLVDFQKSLFGGFLEKMIRKIVCGGDSNFQFMFNFTGSNNREEVVKGLLNNASGIAIGASGNDTALDRTVDQTKNGQHLFDESELEEEIDTFFSYFDDKDVDFRALFSTPDLRRDIINTIKTTLIAPITCNLAKQRLSDNSINGMNAPETIAKECHMVVYLDMLLESILYDGGGFQTMP
ncbi:MAG: hypothetical protein ACRCU3_09130 [Eubacteriaceae bacterium]